MYAEIPEIKVLIKNYEVELTMKTTKIYDNDSQCRAAGGRCSGADEQEKTQRIASGSAQDDNVFGREQDLKGAAYE